MICSADISFAERNPQRQFRLDSRRYAPIFASRRSYYGKTVVMWVGRIPDASRKAGVVVSKRVFRRAVDRNRAKRLMREAFRLTRGQLTSEVDLILVARSGIAGLPCSAVMADLNKLYHRARILTPEPKTTEGNS